MCPEVRGSEPLASLASAPVSWVSNLRAARWKRGISPGVLRYLARPWGSDQPGRPPLPGIFQTAG